MKNRTLGIIALALVAAPVALADYPAVVLADSPLAYYRFEEVPGAGTIADSSGNGLDADYSAPIGTTILGEPGVVGLAALFNGDGGILTPLMFDPSVSDFTIEIVFNPTIIPGDAGIIVSNQNGNGIGRSNLFVHSSANIRSYIGGGATNAGPLFEAEAWYHIILTYDHSAVAGGVDPTIRFYVDGVEQSGSQRVTESASGGWVLGSHKLLDRQFFTGLLDEVAIYDFRLDDPDGDGDTADSRVTPHYDAYQKSSVIKPPILALAVTRNGSDLVFEWESRAGMIYNLTSSTDLAADPLTWELVEGNIPADPPTNTKVILRPGDPTRFYRIEEFPPPPLTLFSENFDGGPELPAGWETGANTPSDTGTTRWEPGDPTGGSLTGPQGANSAPNCVGTNIATDYGTDTDIWLRSPGTIDLTTANAATLVFQQFRDIEALFDLGLIRVLKASDGSQLGPDLRNPTDGTGGWEKITADLPSEALGEIIKLEFSFQADNFGNQAGWYIDDVTVTIPAP
ncbi:MAG: choice-of-anchor J domain-containing protein [Roseibacillus sp.]|jgi:hypothetical protein|nr:choice-of-anchor J domain-containing protein [Roseibacillus sp.]HJM62882.1 LamG-like jellyroll fold domain-containing protein [Roseibacillus sp.]